MRLKAWAVIAASIFLSACGAHSAIPSESVPQRVRDADVQLHIVVPKPSNSSARSAFYVSPSTRSVSVAITPEGGAASVKTAQANCSSTCTLNVSAPVGTDRFDVKLYSGDNGGGKVLSAGSVTANIAANETNHVSMTFDGVPAMVKISVDAQPVVHTPGTVHLIVNAADASGNVIVGPGAYPALDLSNDDSTGTLTLGASSVSAPNTPINVTYNGNWISTGNASANITATIRGTSISTTFAISPQPVLTAYAGPSSNPISAAMTVGSDGALWFTERYGYVGRITTGGTITEYATPSTYEPFGVASGPDGAIWIADGDAGATDMGRMTTSGAYSSCTGVNLQATAIVKGSDGNLWYASPPQATIGRMTTACSQSEFGPVAGVQRMTLGPDGAIWFTQQGSTTSDIGRIATDGTITEYPVPLNPSWPIGIASGPDGYLWFVDNWSGQIGHLKTDGTMTEFPRGSSGASAMGDITTGPDGAMWFRTTDGVGRISLDGQLTDYPGAGSPNQIVLGPDNALWGVSVMDGQIDRISI